VNLKLDSRTDGIQFIRDEIYQQVGKWIPGEPGTDNGQYHFYGGVDFICYHHKDSKNNTLDWTKKIGDFTIFVPQTSIASDRHCNKLILLCIAHSDGYPASTQSLRLISPSMGYQADE
jgi:hypothetical protein